MIEDFEKKINDVVKEILEKHHQIIDDWCKAYMAQRYKDGRSIDNDYI